MIGRTEPSPRTVERNARALFGADIAEIQPDEDGEVRYPRVARGIRMRDGSGRRVEGNQHPDPRAEAVRWSICEAGLIQAIGRGRGVNRTADNPLQIDILTNVVPADRGGRGRRPGTRSSRPSPRSCAPAAPCRSATATWPRRTLICSRAPTPREWRSSRENPEQMPIEKYLIGVCSGFLSVAYRRTGSRGPAGRLLYDPARIDPAAWLAERIGEVTILGEAVPVETEPVAEQPAAAPDPEQQAEDDAWLAALEVAADAIRREPKGRLIPLGVIDPGDVFIAAGLTSERHYRWITDTTGDRIRRCGEPILDDLDHCLAHRAQYAETLFGDPLRLPMPLGPFPCHAPLGDVA